MAMRLFDAVTRQPLSGATVQLNERYQALARDQGFYTLTDMPAGTYSLSITAAGYQRFTTTLTLPLPATAQGVLRVPGENDMLQSVESVDRATQTVTFAARDVLTPLPDGTPVLAPQRSTATSGVLYGASVVEAPLVDVGADADPTRIRDGDLLRFQRAPVIAMRPAASYRFPPFVKRYTGRVLDSADGQPLAGASVRIVAVNSSAVAATAVGPAGNNVDVFSLGSTPATRRALGTVRDMESTADERGSFAFSFLPRSDLTVTSLQLRVSATGYATATGSTINISTGMAHHGDITLVRT